MKNWIQVNVNSALLLTGFLSIASIGTSQVMDVGVDDDAIVIEEVKDEPKGDLIYTVVEENPQYPDGFDKLKEFISKEFKYSKKAIKEKIEGKVFVEFIVHEDGSITDIKTIKGLSQELDAEACRVIGKMKKWTPGRQRGKPVKVRFTLPVECKVPVKKKKQ